MSNRTSLWEAGLDSEGLTSWVSSLQDGGGGGVGGRDQSVQPAEGPSQRAGRRHLPDVRGDREDRGGPGRAAQRTGQQEPQDRGGLPGDPQEGPQVRVWSSLGLSVQSETPRLVGFSQ